MMKLPKPMHTFDASIDACAEGIKGNTKLLDALIASKAELLEIEPNYVNAATLGKLFSTYPVTEDVDKSKLVVGKLCGSDLNKLYDQYLVPEAKPGRKIYSDIFNAAQEECPFCGGIGLPKTLDHFLPQGKHPAFSVLPYNLVPSCRDCNMGEKGQFVPKSAAEVFLHPYADKDIFFSEQWIFASYKADATGEPGVFSYFVKTPDDWHPIDSARAEHHFRLFKLDHLYGLKAAQSLAAVMGQAKALIARGSSHLDVREIILQPVIDCVPFSNHWKKGMYQSLCEYFSDGWLWGQP